MTTATCRVPAHSGMRTGPTKMALEHSEQTMVPSDMKVAPLLSETIRLELSDGIIWEVQEPSKMKIQVGLLGVTVEWGAGRPPH